MRTCLFAYVSTTATLEISGRHSDASLFFLVLLFVAVSSLFHFVT